MIDILYLNRWLLHRQYILKFIYFHSHLSAISYYFLIYTQSILSELEIVDSIFLIYFLLLFLCLELEVKVTLYVTVTLSHDHIS